MKLRPALAGRRFDCQRRFRYEAILKGFHSSSIGFATERGPGHGRREKRVRISTLRGVQEQPAASLVQAPFRTRAPRPPRPSRAGGVSAAWHTLYSTADSE